MAPQARHAAPALLAFALLLAGAAPAAAAVSDRWLPLGPQAGTVLALAASPAGTLYAGTAGDGVYESDDGARWRRTERPASFPGALALAADPGDPDAVYANFESGLFYRRGPGEWRERGPSGALSAFAVAPSDPARLYAAGGSTTWISRDRGASWQPSCCFALPEATALLVDPRDEDVVYGATAGGLFKSVDGGDTWQLLVADAAGAPIVIHSLVLDPADPDVLFAGTARDGIWRSADAGATWVRVRPAAARQDVVAALAVDPTDTRRIYAGVVRMRPAGPPSGQVWRSRDGGATWAKVLDTAAVLSLVVDPTTGRVFAGVEHDGIRKSEDGGTTWRKAGRGLQALPVLDVEVDPHREGGLWVASPEQSAISGSYPGLFASFDAGRSWVRRDPRTGPDSASFQEVVFDPVRRGRLWAFGQDDLWRSVDGGATWEELDVLHFEHNVATELVIDPVRPDRMYLAGSRRELVGDGAIDVPVVWRSTDSGDTWVRVEQFDVPRPSQQDRRLLGLAIHPRRTDTVFALGTTGLFRSRDAGGRWVRISTLPVGCSGPGLSSGTPLVIDPFRPRTLYAAHCDPAQPVLRSTDGGLHWQPLSLRLGGGSSYIRTLAADPHLPGTLYAAGDEGVFVSDDRGATWRPLAEGLPADRRVASLTVDPHVPGRIYAGTPTAGSFGLTRDRRARTR